MKIDTFTIYKYSLPLKKPLYVGGKDVHSREGLIIRITSEDGEEGFGDIAPLKHLSKESLFEATEQTRKLRELILDQDFPEHLERLQGGFTRWLDFLKLSSSVRFGFELAALNLLSNRKKIPLGKLIHASIQDKIQVNGLLHGTKEEIKQQAQKMIEQGFKAFKLKVGADVDEEIEKVQAISKFIEGKAILHLDANQSWDINKAVHFGNEVGLTTVDYIEEPFKNIKDIPDFFMKTTIPAALDESLQSIPIKDLKSIDGLEIIVLKPTALGGIERAHQMIQEAKNVGLSTVISSCYESGVGILALANLAGISSYYHGAGLDTLKWFEEDVLKEPVAISHGKIDISHRMVRSKDINFDVLEKISP
ncbi:MAG TPA: o-succinylbenzoate synthase [Candidatus Omnitrophota bacterium]|nr:o-succinylbenzoate synthase [Candidatus Omnitrophota bacterium]